MPPHSLAHLELDNRLVQQRLVEILHAGHNRIVLAFQTPFDTVSELIGSADHRNAEHRIVDGDHLVNVNTFDGLGKFGDMLPIHPTKIVSRHQRIEARIDVRAFTVLAPDAARRCKERHQSGRVNIARTGRTDGLFR